MHMFREMVDKSFYENGVKESVLLSRANFLRGIFAVLIVLGHCSMRFETEPFFLLIIHKANFIWVCFFLYISGWSLAYNHDNRGNYLNNFLCRKPLKLFILALEAEVIGRALKTLLLDEIWNVDIGLVTEWNWYIYECLIMYFLFYFVYKNINNKKTLLIILWMASIVLAVIFWMLYNWGTWDGWTFAYYYSTLSFPLGVSQHYMLEKNKYTKKNVVSITIIAVVISLISIVSVMLPQKSFLGGVVLHNTLGCGFLIVFTFVLFFVDVTKFRAINFFTRYATNIYFYQFCVITIITGLYQRAGMNIDGGYVILVLVVTMSLSILVEKFNSLIFEIQKYLSKG